MQNKPLQNNKHLFSSQFFLLAGGFFWSHLGSPKCLPIVGRLSGCADLAGLLHISGASVAITGLILPHVIPYLQAG